MSGIDMTRVLLGGVVAGIVTFVLEGISGTFYMERMYEALSAHNITTEMSASAMLPPVLVSLLGGSVLIFLYAAARPRFGAGPKTAVIVAVAMWLGGYLLSLIGYAMMGLFPALLLVHWGITGLIEMILAALAGAWLYKEA